MVLRNTNETTPDIRRVTELQAADATNISALGQAVIALQTTINGILSVQANSPAAPVAALLWDSDLSHSNFTWYEISGTPSGDKNEECAFFYSHTKPSTAQNFTVITTNDQIPLPDHDYETGCAIDFFDHGGGETLPTGLAFSTTYFVYALDANTVQLATDVALAQAGTPDVSITAATGSGTHTVQQVLIATTSYTSAKNNELKTIAHSTFNPYFSKWDAPHGQGDMTTTTTIDTPLPSNMVDATVNLARISLIAARANQYIEIPNADLFGAGLWDNTSGQRCFLTGSIGFSASLVGTTGSTERRFRVYYQSDRGYSLLSDEVTILNGLADGLMDDLNYIQMSWLQQAGQLQVEIYEHYDPSGVNEYRLVATVSSATSFIYEGDYLSVVSGYPTPTETTRTATFFTETEDMSDLAINGIAPQWDTVNFPTLVPNNYNKANTTNRQWLRLWQTVAANIYINGNVIGDGSDTIAIPDGIINTAAFASGGYGTGATSLYTNLAVQLYDQDDVYIGLFDIIDTISNTSLQLSHGIPAYVNYKLRIIGGGFHGIIIDKIHLGFQQNTSWAPNANDVRVLQPVASPTSSTQGGVGNGGSGGGVNTCIAAATPVKQLSGEWVPIAENKIGVLWSSDGVTPNQLCKLRPGFEAVRCVRTENNIEILATDTEAFITPTGKHYLRNLRVGDEVWTDLDNRRVISKLAEISELLPQQIVITPSLSGNHLFIAGEYKGKRDILGGFVLSNEKPLENPVS